MNKKNKKRLILLKLFLIVFVLIPDTVGYFLLLRWYGNHTVVSMVGAVILEIGGAPITLFNTVVAIPQATALEVPIILIGVVPAVISAWTFIFVWTWVWMGVSAGNLPKFWAILSGVFVYVIFALAALFIEFGLIPADAPRVGGLSYTISNLQMALEPFVDLIQANVIEPQPVGEAANQTLNESVNQTTDHALNTTTGNSSVK